MKNLSTTPHGPSSRLKQWGTKLNTLLAITTAGAISVLAIANKDQIRETWREIRELVDPTVPTELTSPRNLAATPVLQNSKDVSDTTEYNNGYEKMTRTNLVNAAQVVTAQGRSEDAQAFNSLWDYLTTCGMIVNNQGTFSGTNMVGGFRVEKNIRNKKWNKVANAPHLYTLEVSTNQKNKRLRTIKFSWTEPEVEGSKKNVIHVGYREFQQLGENGSIQVYETGITGRRIWPFSVNKAELIDFLGKVPGLQP